MLNQRIFIALLLFALSIPGFAKPLKVVVVGAPPFVVIKEGVPDGISVRIWDAAAELDHLKFDMVTAGTVREAFDMLKSGEADVAVGPISITSKRAEEVAFTQPYFRSGLGILSAKAEKTIKDKILHFLTGTFFYGVLFLGGLLAVVGSLVWLCERKKNPEQFSKGIGGLANGMWLAVVTMTTVGSTPFYMQLGAAQ